ncbi:RFC4-like protein [Mya arenaria]|uniref:RFC4-like protein n=1 Tax=Mya arenaria TaxID=6604 RepID=A0ABY7G5D4_MYAAR|nr:RFC4-like protein [Mya arenaria]
MPTSYRDIYKTRVLELNASDERGISVVREKVKNFSQQSASAVRPDRIIEPIASRCAKFRFKPLAEEILTKRLRHICEEEKIACEDEALTALLNTSEGDLRKAITFLQSAGRLKSEATITQADIYEIAGVIPDDVIDGLITDLMNEGHAASQLILQLHDKLVEMDSLGDKQKSLVLDKLAVSNAGLNMEL